MDDLTRMSALEKRIERIEERLGWPGDEADIPSLHPAAPLVLGLAAVVLGYLGLGLPQHYYQVLFSLLLMLLVYHRGRLLFSRGPWKWPQLIVNFLVLCLLFKLLIGGGVSHPFDWFKLPALAKNPPADAQSWYSAVVPDYTVHWQTIPKLAEWSIDITKVQTLMLLANFAGVLFRFEPFTSITALVLIVISLPAYLSFDWDWIILFVISGGLSIYLQAGTSFPEKRGGVR